MTEDILIFLHWRAADHHGREGITHNALNEDVERCCDLRERAEELSLRGFSRDKKQVVSKIKNMLAFVHL